ncbi:hypothetical protein HED49_06760 [Ochrobactrum daejeonense]|nr:hypothetical protein [Brucella daejeonensis]
MPRIATADEQEADRQFRLKGLCRLQREISFARLGPRKGGINDLRNGQSSVAIFPGQRRPRLARHNDRPTQR